MSADTNLEGLEDLDKVIEELNKTNKVLFEINRNIANLVLV